MGGGGEVRTHTPSRSDGVPCRAPGGRTRHESEVDRRRRGKGKGIEPHDHVNPYNSFGRPWMREDERDPRGPSVRWEESVRDPRCGSWNREGRKDRRRHGWRSTFRGRPPVLPRASCPSFPFVPRPTRCIGFPPFLGFRHPSRSIPWTRSMHVVPPVHPPSISLWFFRNPPSAPSPRLCSSLAGVVFRLRMGLGGCLSRLVP